MVTLCLLVAFRFPPTQQPLLEIPLPKWVYFPFNWAVVPRDWPGVGGWVGWGGQVVFEEPKPPEIAGAQRWFDVLPPSCVGISDDVTGARAAGLAGYLPLRGGRRERERA